MRFQQSASCAVPSTRTASCFIVCVSVTLLFLHYLCWKWNFSLTAIAAPILAPWFRVTNTIRTGAASHHERNSKRYFCTELRFAQTDLLFKRYCVGLWWKTRVFTGRLWSLVRHVPPLWIVCLGQQLSYLLVLWWGTNKYFSNLEIKFLLDCNRTDQGNRPTMDNS